MSVAASFTITKVWKQSVSVIDEWINQLWDFHTLEFYLAIKRQKILPFETVWMDLENIMLRQTGQSEKDKYYMIPLMWNLINKLN